MLRPSGTPARLLLSLWQAQAQGQGRVTVSAGPDRDRLLSLDYIRAMLGDDVGERYALTDAGRRTAQTIEAGS